MLEGRDTELGEFFNEGRVGGHGQTVDIHQNDCVEVRVFALDSGRFSERACCGTKRGGGVRELFRQCGDIEGAWTFEVTFD